MDDALYLLSTTYEPNEVGVEIPTNKQQRVILQRNSATRSEYAAAGRNGLNPEYFFTIAKPEYHGESICEHNGLTYTIYRTYEVDEDYIELYVARKGGTNGEVSDD